jgi:hypothetical protein
MLNPTHRLALETLAVGDALRTVTHALRAIDRPTEEISQVLRHGEELALVLVKVAGQLAGREGL